MKRVRFRFVAALAAALLLAAFTFASVSTESLLNSPVGDISTFTCPSQETFVFGFNEDQTAKMYGTQKRFIVVKFAVEEVTEIVFGTWKRVDKKIQVVESVTMSLEQAKIRYPHPCDFLAPLEV